MNAAAAPADTQLAFPGMRSWSDLFQVTKKWSDANFPPALTGRNMPGGMSIMGYCKLLPDEAEWDVTPVPAVTTWLLKNAKHLADDTIIFGATVRPDGMTLVTAGHTEAEDVYRLALVYSATRTAT